MSFHESMNEYKKQLEKGTIIEAYRGLMEYFNTLRLYFKKKYPDDSVSGSVYYGYMDMTYFSFFKKSLKHRKLKIAIVFLHEAFRFEVWLSASNKDVQTKYMKLFSECGWKEYNIAITTEGVDSILDHILIDNPDFSDLDALTKQIERGTLNFTQDIESFLSNH
ncbi:MAG: hypothetical protein AM326_10290 [Candidatus Thorarchaeota archaeon SMTZ-45]|nr:MAG: hypothetical protein AM326_10290 [Candidatus Thorarchaeota archaeon SMTZ-45]KXH75566.1 MAG: hypothetical protein AM325_04060 [Candidatus Thorarchaeota archaeon SMTZ1-45]